MNSGPAHPSSKTAAETSFHKRLLRSHLLIVLVSLPIIVIGLLITLHLKDAIVAVSNHYAPMAQNIAQLQSGLRDSISATRNVTTTDNPALRKEWETAWENAITPAARRIAASREILSQTAVAGRLERLPQLLEELKSSQRHVLDLAFKAENQPARKLYQEQLLPTAERIERALQEAIQRSIEDTQVLTLSGVLTLNEADTTLAEAQSLLAEIIIDGEIERETAFTDRLRKLEALLFTEANGTTDSAHNTGASQSPSQPSLAEPVLRQEFARYRSLARQAIAQRKSPEWNRAIYTLENESRPILGEVMFTVTGLSEAIAQTVQQRSSAARDTAVIAIAALGLLTLLIPVAAVFFARRQTLALARPMEDLSKATQAFTESHAYTPLPVESNDELGKLTENFNHMAAQIAALFDEQAEAEHTLNAQVDFLQSLIDAIPLPIYVKDESQTYISCNKAFEELISKQRSEIIGHKTPDLVEGENLYLYYQTDQEVLESGEAQTFESVQHYKGKGQRAILVHKAAYQRKDGKGRCIIGAIVDITDRKQHEDELRLAAKVFESTSEAIMVTDVDNRITSVNTAFEQITGFSEDEVLGQSSVLLRSGRHDAAFYQNMWRSLHEIGHWEGEVWNRRKNGEVYPEWLSITAITDDKGAPVQYVSLFSDISHKKAAEEELRFHAHFDPLTGLPNRALFYDRLSQAIKQAHNKNCNAAILLIDLDRFKNVNDTLGHTVGDMLLKEVGQRLQSCIDEDETAARPGGDEFMIVLPELDTPDRAAQVAERILSTLSAPFNVEGNEIFIGASIGIALYPDDADDVPSLVKYADIAMYNAKAIGRNTFNYFSPELTESAGDRLLIESALRQAIQQQALTLNYQPIVDLQTQTTIAAEALLRWQHPELGFVSPATFIPIAEETGLIAELGEWVLLQACREAANWQVPGRMPIRISVNLSLTQIARGLSPKRVAEILDEADFPPELLTLEITESVMMGDTSKTLSWLKEAKQLGISFSVDDFGTGYSSLNYLKRFPVDHVKIDRAFIKDVTENIEDSALVSAVVAIGDSLKLKTIAEGVETAEQLAEINRLGCHYAQGYYFSRPVPGPEFRAFIGLDDEPIAVQQ